MEKYVSNEYGFIARTNSEDIDDETFENEIKYLAEKYSKMVKYGCHKARFNCLYEAPPGYISSIRDSYSEEITDIITDNLTLIIFIKNNGIKTKQKLFNINKVETNQCLINRRGFIVSVHFFSSSEPDVALNSTTRSSFDR